MLTKIMHLLQERCCVDVGCQYFNGEQRKMKLAEPERQFLFGKSSGNLSGLVLGGLIAQGPQQATVIKSQGKIMELAGIDSNKLRP